MRDKARLNRRARYVARKNNPLIDKLDGVKKDFAALQRRVELGNSFYLQIAGLFAITVIFLAVFYIASPGEAQASEESNRGVVVINNFQSSASGNFLSGVGLVESSDIPVESISEPVEYSVYIVKSGDNLYNISIQLGVELDELKNFNNLVEPYSLDIGDEIVYSNYLSQ